MAREVRKFSFEDQSLHTKVELIFFKLQPPKISKVSRKMDKFFTPKTIVFGVLGLVRGEDLSFIYYIQQLVD